MKDVYCWAEKVTNQTTWVQKDLYTYPDAFKDSYPQAMTLHIPETSIEDYRSTEPWSLFGKIVALSDDDPSPTGIRTLKEDNSGYPVGIYSLDGKPLQNEQRGINIIRKSDGSIKKVMIK